MPRPPIDMLGNELKIDDLVRVDLKQNFVIGKIIDLDQGMIVRPNANTPQGMEGIGTMRINVELTIKFRPGAALVNITAVKEPKKLPTDTPVGKA